MDVEFLINRPHVAPHGVNADFHAVSDFLVGVAVGELVKKFQALLQAKLTDDEKKAARYFGVMLARELAVDAKAFGLKVDVPVFSSDNK